MTHRPHVPSAVICLAVALGIVAGACRGSTTAGGAVTTPVPTSSTTPLPVATTTTVAAGQSATLGPERVPIPNGPALGPVNSAVYGQTIDGIQCQTSEQAVYHIHAHLAVFVDGQPRQVPLGIGIGTPLKIETVASGRFVVGGSCFYWLHTHSSDGVIHIESPTQMQYTLGQFFDVWGQTLSAGRVGPASGAVTAYLDGQPVTGDPRAIQLGTHSQVQLDVGRAVAAQAIDWGPSGL